jgi:hypothetical protein
MITVKLCSFPGVLGFAGYSVADPKWWNLTGENVEGCDLRIRLVQIVGGPEMYIHSFGPFCLPCAAGFLRGLAFTFGLWYPAFRCGRKHEAVCIRSLGLGCFIDINIFILDAGATSAGSTIVGSVAINGGVG